MIAHLLTSIPTFQSLQRGNIIFDRITCAEMTWVKTSLSLNMGIVNFALFSMLSITASPDAPIKSNKVTKYVVV